MYTIVVRFKELILIKLTHRLLTSAIDIVNRYKKYNVEVIDETYLDHHLFKHTER